MESHTTSAASDTRSLEISGAPSGSLDNDISEPPQLGLESDFRDTTSDTVVEGLDLVEPDCEQNEELCGDTDNNVDHDNDSIASADSFIGEDEEHEEEEEEVSETLVSPGYLKIVIGVFLLSIILFVIIDSVCGENYVSQAIAVFLEWTRENRGAGMAAYIVVYIFATLICVPGALLTLGAGYVFSTTNDGSLVVGIALGTIAVFVGSSIGAMIAFILARYLLYDRVRRLSQRYSIFEALDIALSEKGLRIMCLLRLSPITPFVLLNYIAGVTTVNLKNYTLSIFCMLPGMVLYVFLGASAGSLTDETENQTVTIIAVSLGVVFGGLAIGMTSHYSRKELNKEVDLVRSRLYNRTTSRRNRQRYKRNSLRRQRSRYRRRIDRKRFGKST